MVTVVNIDEILEQYNKVFNTFESVLNNESLKSSGEKVGYMTAITDILYFLESYRNDDRY